MEQLPDFLETAMLLCFGASWPLNLAKAWRARSAKAISLPFLLLIVGGYIVGVTAKVIKLARGETVAWYVMTVYIFNLVITSLNLAVYFRNYRLDKAREGR